MEYKPFPTLCLILNLAQLQLIRENGYSHGRAQLIIRNLMPRFRYPIFRLCM